MAFPAWVWTGEDVFHMGVVFQSYALFPHKTIFDNVGFGLRMRRVPRAEIAGRVRSMLDTVGLQGVEARLPEQLSGGQRQRVALARALVIEPAVLLLDEPLSNLDAVLRKRMRQELRDLQRRLAITTIFVTHDQDEAFEMSDRVVLLNHGRIEQMGTPVEIAALTTLFSLLLGYPLAYLLARTRSAWRGVLLFLVVAPLMTGVIVRTYGWIVLMGSQGLINGALLWLGIVAQPLQILNTQTAVVIALVHILMPYVVFPVFSALAAQDPNLERAASTLGASRLRIFSEVTLPLSRSGVVMGSVLVFTLSAGAVVTPTLLGGKNVSMLGQLIYDLVLHTLNWPLASAVALILVAMQFAIIFVYLRGSRRGPRPSQG